MEKLLIRMKIKQKSFIAICKRFEEILIDEKSAKH